MESNKEIAKRWLDAVGEGDGDTMRDLMTDDAIWELMGASVIAGKRSRDEVVQLAAFENAALKNGIEFDYLYFTAEEDRVAVEFTGRSELVTGGNYNNVYHMLFHFRDGKIALAKEYCDSKITDAALGPLLAQAEAASDGAIG